MKSGLPILLFSFFASCYEAPRPVVIVNPSGENFASKYSKGENSEIDSNLAMLVGMDAASTWKCEFFSNRLHIITNRFRDTFVIRNDLSYQIKNYILLNPFKLSSAEEKFSVEILAETCDGKTDDEAVFSDSAKKLLIQLNNRVLKGCITLTKNAPRPPLPDTTFVDSLNITLTQ